MMFTLHDSIAKIYFCRRNFTMCKFLVFCVYVYCAQQCMRERYRARLLHARLVVRPAAGVFSMRIIILRARHSTHENFLVVENGTLQFKNNFYN